MASKKKDWILEHVQKKFTEEFHKRGLSPDSIGKSPTQTFRISSHITGHSPMGYSDIFFYCIICKIPMEDIVKDIKKEYRDKRIIPAAVYYAD